MLNILFREDEREIRYTDSYFNNNYQDEWFEDDLVKQIIKDIDLSDVLNAQIVISPVLGAIPDSDQRRCKGSYSYAEKV